ncbi:hypothetical protein Q0812_11750 [Brevundimonas sp. 2R-24]|uniref:Uncharacterized protein n=1 Tax=Peiella sedimenti TaxID=3061083 RepID=A0ABT8SND9_9CAUL|nr:hypothetical protein [Caulobacteraceae bacterium XZ-24]
MGQRAAALSGAAILLKTLERAADTPNLTGWWALAGAEHAAVLTAAASLVVTAYFVLRVWEDRLASQLDHQVAQVTGAGSQAQSLPDELGANLEGNARLQAAVKSAIALFDIWVPLVMAGAVVFMFATDFREIGLRLLTML